METTTVDKCTRGRVRSTTRRSNSYYILQSVFRGSSRAGVDLRPFLVRVSIIILRPMRSEMAEEVAQLRREIEHVDVVRRRTSISGRPRSRQPI